MTATTASQGGQERVIKLVPGGALGLAQLTDDELLANTRRLVGKSNQLLAALLVHLAEVEARGVHRARRCASLYTYCIYELRFSEDAAARRSAAARIVKQFPVLFEAIADGELHLTGLLMIGPHLTLENHLEVLGRAKFRTKKELTKLVRELNPLPQSPDRIEVVGSVLTLPPRKPTWAEFAASLCPHVRDLPEGERPRDWANRGLANDDAGVPGRELPGDDDDSLPVGPVPSDLSPVTGPQYYQLQFSAVEEHVRLIERAKALLARARPHVTLGALHFEAMQLFVAALERRKFAITERPRERRERETEPTPGHGGSVTAPNAEPAEAPRQPRDVAEQLVDVVEEPPRRHGNTTSRRDATTAEPPRQRGDAASELAAKRRVPPRQGGRHVPAAERREVYRRDGGRCAYVDARGERCCETRYLEIHHVTAFARGGEPLRRI